MSASVRFPRNLMRCATLMAIATLLACTVTIDSEGETQNAALIDRLPSGATAIAWIDFEALAESMTPEEWNEYERMFERDEDMQDLERFTEATGIDLREDMKQVAVAVMPGDGEEDEPLVLAHVLYDEDRLMELFAGAETLTYEGATMYAATDVFRQLEETLGQGDEDEMPDEPGETEVESQPEDEIQGYLVMLDDRTIAMGSEASLEVIIDVDSGRRDALKMDPQMNDLISDVAGQGQIWFVAKRETWADRMGELGAAGGMVPTNAVETIEVVTMSVRMGGGMAMRLTGVAGSAEDATLLAETLRGWTAMGKMMLQQNQPELFNILDRGVSVGQDDRTVHIEATLSQDDIDVLRRLAEDQMEASGVVGSGS